MNLGCKIDQVEDQGEAVAAGGENRLLCSAQLPVGICFLNQADEVAIGWYLCLGNRADERDQLVCTDARLALDIGIPMLKCVD